MQEQLTLEHIDPRNHPLVCGLKNAENEVVADATYNYSKSANFVPYRVFKYPAPVHPGDLCEFCINGDWVVDHFITGSWWKQEALRLRNFYKVNGGPPRVNWENRIKIHEERWNCKIIVSSGDGILRKHSQAVRLCSHESPRPTELWRLVREPRKHCCRTHQNISQNQRRFGK